MKKYSVLSIVFNLIAILLYITGIILIASDANTTLGLALNSLASVFLILGIFLSRKSRNEDK